MNKKITSSDVAKHLGVSRSAVSRAFTDGASINPEKRTLILEAAKELGYQPNIFARNLSTPAQKAKSNLIAILISDFSNPFQSYLFEELSTTLQLAGKQPMLLNVKEERDLDQAILRLSGYQVDGAIAVMGSLSAESVNRCLSLSMPLVTLGRADGLGNVPSVQTDNQMAGKLAAEHLLGLGCKRLGYLAGRRDGQASIERWQGFSKVVCAELGTDPQILEAGRYGYSAGFETAVKSTEALRELDGVFCASDALALGVVDACQQFAGINIPNQLRVVGCDNVPQAAWQGYQLTTVAQPVKDIAVQALEALENIGREHSANKPIIRVKPFLKVRKT